MEKLKISDRVYVATELVASFKDAMFDIVDIGKTTWLCWKYYQKAHLPGMNCQESGFEAVTS